MKKRIKHKTKNTELRSRIEKLEKGRIDIVNTITKFKAKVVKLRDDSEKNNQ